MYLAPLNYDRFFRKIFSDEKRTWEEVDRLERGIYEDGKKDGEKIGIEKGQAEIVISMIKHGMEIQTIAEITDSPIEKIELLKTAFQMENAVRQ